MISKKTKDKAMIQISRRFAQFVFFKCRTVNTGGRFLGPEWARIAINKVLKYNNDPMFYKQ